MEDTVVIFKEGDKVSGVCEKCGKEVSLTLRYEVLNYNGVNIPNVMQKICDLCGSSIGTMPQSAGRIADFVKKYMQTIEIKIAKHHLDILYEIGIILDCARPGSVFKTIVDAYIDKADDEGYGKIAEKLIEIQGDELTKGEYEERIRCFLRYEGCVSVKKLEEKVGVDANKILSSMIVMGKYDILDTEDIEMIKRCKEKRMWSLELDTFD